MNHLKTPYVKNAITKFKFHFKMLLQNFSNYLELDICGDIEIKIKILIHSKVFTITGIENLESITFIPKIFYICPQ